MRILIVALLVIFGAGFLYMLQDRGRPDPSYSIANAAMASEVKLYKNPQCGCCEEYAGYLKRNGFDVEVTSTPDLQEIKKQAGVPDELAACHTMLIDGYVVEGHVPLATLNRLLSERPGIQGISLPGMPLGSPGMTGTKTEPFTIYEITEGEPKVYAVE